MSGSEIIFYHYTYSPYARRVVWYLALRGIPYKQCMQPAMLPRPDVARLGISYRRIPIMAIGRDVYLDSRLQLEKLEAMAAGGPRLAPTTGEHKALSHLLSRLMIDAGVFRQGVTLLPTDLALLQDEKYWADRGEYLGTPFSRETIARARPEAAAGIVSAFEFLESTLLADGRSWILGGGAPSMADIEAVWPFHWLSGIPGALSPEEGISAERFPRVYAWIGRFQEAVSGAKRLASSPETVSGEDAARIIEGAGWHDAEGAVDEGDPVVKALGLRKGDVVVLSPTDTGRAHKDVGRLVSLDGREVVIEVVTGSKGSVRVHAPRHGFRIQKEKRPML